MLPAWYSPKDEWIDTLGFEINSPVEFRVASIEVRKLVSSHTRDLLRVGRLRGVRFCQQHAKVSRP